VKKWHVFYGLRCVHLVQAQQSVGCVCLFPDNNFWTLYFVELSSLQHRRQQLARDFFQSLLDPITHAFTLHRAITILLPDSVLPNDFRHWPHEPKMPVFYKFWPLKLSINLGPFSKSVVQSYLYYFYSFMFTLVMHRLMHNCISTVLLVT